MNIEMRHLRYFAAVAEDATFTAAAQRVHVTQQVLSTQIRQLEAAVGTQLLERTSRGVVLTPAGSAFLGFARETLASLDRGVAAARNASLQVSGLLRVGLQAATGGTARSRALAEFERAYPSVSLVLRAYDLAAPAAGLLDYGSDVALIRPPVDAPGLLLEEIAREPRVFVLPSGHPLAACSSLGLADVAGLPWVAAPRAVDGCAPARWRDDWLVAPRPGGDVPVIGAEARTIEEWREHIAAGRGISLCPASSETFSARPDIVFVAARGVPPTSLCVAWRADDVRPEVLAFVKAATASAGTSGAGASEAGASDAGALGAGAPAGGPGAGPGS
ncbi:MAG: LysR family transcriptional regulator [Actinobacteria bacterium]|nr:LysR family transcriptional regulator [Actinomycetota bacterium]